MEFIEKHKALIITSMLMGIFVLSLYNINMVNKKKEKSEIMMEIPEEIMEQLFQEDEPPEEPIVEEEKLDIPDAKRTHDAFNEDFEDSDDFEKRLKSITEAEQSEAESSKTEEMAEGEAAINEDIGEKNDIKEKAATKETYNRNSSSKYDLKNRKIVGRMPNPIYTCDGSGKVVVKITVNQNGYVIDAKVDKKKSSTRNECLFDNALEYAQKALFTTATTKDQKGSITYYFNYGG